MSEQWEEKLAQVLGTTHPATELEAGWERDAVSRMEKVRPERKTRRWVAAAAVTVVAAAVVVGAVAAKTGVGSQGNCPARTLRATVVKNLQATEKPSLVAVLDPFVAAEATGAFWGPGGAWVGYTESWDGRIKKGPKQVWRVRPDGSGAERLLELDEAGSTMALYANLSPTGEYLAYYDGKQLRVRSLLTKQESEVPGAVYMADYAWSPDGKSIAYVHYGLPPANGVRSFASNEAREQAEREVSGLFVWRVGEAAPKKIVDVPSNWNPGPGEPTVGQPRWSPDGKQIAFVETTDILVDTEVLALQPFAQDLSFMVVRPDGAGLRVLTTIRQRMYWPYILSEQCWSPDSRRLVFTWTEVIGQPKLVPGKSPRFSPPADQIVPHGLTVLNMTTGELTVVVPASALGSDAEIWTGASWSTRGDEIAFVAVPKDRTRTVGGTLYLANATNGDYSAFITTGDVIPSMPVWSPGGDALLYTRYLEIPKPHRELWRVELR